MKYSSLGATTLLAVLLSQSAAAQSQYGEERVPRWMTPEAGFIDSESGSKVEEVSETPEPGVYRVRVSVPKVDKPIEEVVVIGQKPDQKSFEIPVEYELINDLDNDRSGIILFMGKEDKFALRINYHDGSHAVYPTSDPLSSLRPD